MKRRLFSLLLAVCLLAGLLPAAAYAADVSSADRSAIDNLLSWYAWYGADYNCTAAAASYGGSWHGNLLMGVVCHPECVNFRLYPVTFRKNWSGRDPQGRWNSYSAIRASEAEWILRNIFHCTQTNIARMRSALSAYRHVYYQDGYYYAQLLGVGDGFFTKNMRVYSYGKLWLIQYQLYADPSNSYLYTRYAVVGKSSVDGKDYWTLYYLDEEAPSDTGFLDVDDDAYYASGVSWALDNEITNGVSDYGFAPDQACTRAQAVTFLWRTAGCPAPNSTQCPFTDVSPGAYYYPAMLWAVEKGITNGMTETTFVPDAPCTRAQIVTFLYRAAGSPPVGNGGGSFFDVPRDSYYYGPVLWALANAITQGTEPGRFSPNDKCTRGQIVTFLRRFVFNT